MINEREAGEFGDDIGKWGIWFDLKPESMATRREESILVKFNIKRKEPSYLTKSDLEELKKDLQDLGKFRVIKQGRKFLEDE